MIDKFVAVIVCYLVYSLVQAGIDGVPQDPERVLRMTAEGVANPDEHHIGFVQDNWPISDPLSVPLIAA